MLSKIIENNRNFITTFIIILFAAAMLAASQFNFNHLKVLSTWAIIVVSMVILVIHENKIAYFRNQYFSFFLMLLCFTFYKGNQSFQFYAAFFFLCIIQGQFITHIRFNSALFNTFDLGFFSGFIILFYPPFAVFLLPMWGLYIFSGKTALRMLVLNIIGFLIFIIGLMLVLATFDLGYRIAFMQSKLELNFSIFSYQDFIFIPLIGILILAFVDYIKYLNRHLEHKKMVYFALFLYIISATLYIIFWGGNQTEKYIVLVFPVAMLYANYFTFNKNRFQKEVFLWLIIFCVFLFKINHFLTIPIFLQKLTF